MNATTDSQTTREALSFIPAADREIWVRMGMAVKSELGDAEGFSIWDDWSKDADSYKERDSRAVWRSIRPEGGTTIKSLFAEAIRHGYVPSVSDDDLAKKLWDIASPCVGHAYLDRKGIGIHGARIEHAERLRRDGKPLTNLRGKCLLYPVRIDGRIIALQVIGEGGQKRFIGKFSGGSFTFGKLKDASKVCIGEGIATAASIFEATDIPTICAFSCGNLEKVARRLRASLHDVEIFVCSDLGNGERQAVEAARAVRGLLALPDFGPDRKNGQKDFNDLALVNKEAVQAAVAHAKRPPEATLPDDSAGDVTSTAIEGLAKLSPIQYDRCREAKAKELGVRVTTLDKEIDRLHGDDTDDEKSGTAMVFDEPEPWPKAVDGARLLNDLSEIFKRYVILPAGAEIILALWVLHTWLHDAARVSPILCIKSPEKRCGKTTVLTLLNRVVKKPLAGSNISSSALFRATELWRPTLLIDEADSFLKDNEEMRGVLNSGHTRATAFIIRNVASGDDHEPRRFCTWSPKCIALIGNLPATLADRSITVSMRRKLPGENVERLKLSECFDDIVRRAARWSSDHQTEVAIAEPDTPAGLDDRAADNWRELAAIAKVAGGEWPRLCSDHMTKLERNDDGDEHAGVQLLADIRQFLNQVKPEKVLWSADLLAHLITLADRPWPDFRNGKAITQRQIARLLRPFKITPETTRQGTKQLKGYAVESFDDAFVRYLPILSVPPYQTNENNILGDFPCVPKAKYGTDKKEDKPLINKDCYGGTDKKTQNPETQRSPWIKPEFSVIPTPLSPEVLAAAAAYRRAKDGDAIPPGHVDF